MYPNQYSLTPSDIYRYAVAVLQPHLKWRDHGPKCTVTTVLQILFLCRRAVVFCFCRLSVIGYGIPRAIRPCAMH